MPYYLAKKICIYERPPVRMVKNITTHLPNIDGKPLTTTIFICTIYIYILLKKIIYRHEEKKSGMTSPGIEPELLELPCL